jgi:hypothetical protein
MFCAPGLILGGTEGVRCSLHVLCFHTFSGGNEGVGLVFKFCTTRLIFSGSNGGNEGAASKFHVSRFWTHFRRYRGRRVPFSCFALLNPFRAETRAASPIFMFRAPGLVSSSIRGVRSHFLVLCS